VEVTKWHVSQMKNYMEEGNQNDLFASKILDVCREMHSSLAKFNAIIKEPWECDNSNNPLELMENEGRLENVEQRSGLGNSRQYVADNSLTMLEERSEQNVFVSMNRNELL